MKRFWLVFIVAVAFLLRAIAIQYNPPAMSWDEVSIGYNAYSILKTGRDEHGRFLPIDTFVAYGDYKPPLAIYLTVPFVAVFGLNELAVRLPSALTGTLTVLLAFFLVSELVKRKQFDKWIAEYLPLVVSAVLAISPWHINLSRAGYEANIALCFVTLGTWLVLRAARQPKLWYVAWIPYVLSMYTFNSSRYFVVFFGLGMAIFCFTAIKKEWKNVLFGLVIAGVCLIPLVPHLVSKEARLRFVEVNIFTDASVVTTSNERIAREGKSVIGKLLNNRRVGYARSYLIHFFDNLQPDFLFVTGDGNPKFSIQDVGQLHLMEAPLFAIGIVALCLADWKTGLLLLYWIVAAIVPAATARETPHALRILNSLPTWHIFIAFGLLTILAALRNRKMLLRMGMGVFVVLYGLSMTYYLHNYYRHYPIEFSGEWQYGYKEALQEAQPLINQYDQVVMTESIGRPYMYTLFYTKTDPNEFFRTKSDAFDAAGFYHVYGFGKYHFGGTLPSALSSNTLYIWDAGAIPDGVHVIKMISLLNGRPVLVLFDTNGAPK